MNKKNSSLKRAQCTYKNEFVIQNLSEKSQFKTDPQILITQMTICKCWLNNKLLNSKNIEQFVCQLMINLRSTGNILEPTATDMWLEIACIRETHFLGECI